MIDFDQKTPPEILGEIAERVRARRKEYGFTQARMAKRAGMSLASYKRFEREHKISLESLVKLAIALDCESDFDGLFERKGYASIEEVIADARR